MGANAAAILEINAFRTSGDPEVLCVQSVKKFLAGLVGEDNDNKVTVKNVRWYSPHNQENDGYENTVNQLDTEPIDEELKVHGEITHNYLGRNFKYAFATEPHDGDEYAGNEESHSIVIRFSDGANALLALRRWILTRRLATKKAITDCIGVVTT